MNKLIVYNNKYRGPLEYDKFILNVFQYLNEINYLIETIEAIINIDEKSKIDDIKDPKTFQEKYAYINQEYDKCITRSEELNLLLLNYKEA